MITDASSHSPRIDSLLTLYFRFSDSDAPAHLDLYEDAEELEVSQLSSSKFRKFQTLLVSTLLHDAVSEHNGHNNGSIIREGES